MVFKILFFHIFVHFSAICSHRTNPKLFFSHFVNKIKVLQTHFGSFWVGTMPRNGWKMDKNVKKQHFSLKKQTIVGFMKKNEVFSTSEASRRAKNDFVFKKKFLPKYYACLLPQKNFQTYMTSGSAGLRKNVPTPPLRWRFGIRFFIFVFAPILAFSIFLQILDFF